MAKMLYQGHGSYRFVTDSGTVIYVDPFAGEGYDLPANLILVTHEHSDHNQVDKMPHAQDCTVLRPKHFLPKPGDYRCIFIPECEAAAGTGTKGNGIRVTAVQACNKYHDINECVGLIIEMDGVRFYAAGDTSTTEDMNSGKLAKLVLDYATFPGDGFYNMDVKEASECALKVEAAHSIPVHLVPVHDPNDAVLFSRERAEEFQTPGRLIMEPGDEIELEASIE